MHLHIDKRSRVGLKLRTRKVWLEHVVTLLFERLYLPRSVGKTHLESCYSVVKVILTMRSYSQVVLFAFALFSRYATNQKIYKLY